MDLVNELTELIKKLNVAVSTLKIRGRALAEAESKYRVNLAQLLLQLREAGHPITILNDIARGNPDVAHLRLERDVAESLYQVNIEYINSVKLQCRLLENQIQREWGNKNG
jgi:hypothetical protein